MRLALLVAALLTAAGLGAAYASGAFGGDSQPVVAGVAPPPPDATELAAIRQLVLRESSTMGEPHPTDGVVVPTTRRLAELVDVDTNEADTPVYFVLARGDFTAYDASVPPGGKPPTGSILTLTIDPSTNESIGTGLPAAMPDLSSMGTPQPLPGLASPNGSKAQHVPPRRSPTG
jgi:hypothetical protein